MTPGRGRPSCRTPCGTGKTVKRPELDGAQPALAPLIKPPTGLGRFPAGDAIVADLVAAGYVVKDKDGPRQRTIGEMLDLLIGAKTRGSADRTCATDDVADNDNDGSPDVQPIRPAVDEAWTAAHRDGS